MTEPEKSVAKISPNHRKWNFPGKRLAKFPLSKDRNWARPTKQNPDSKSVAQNMNFIQILRGTVTLMWC